MKLKTKYHHKYPLSLAVILIVAWVVPICTNYFPMGHDTYFHYLRIHSLATEFLNGNFFAVRFYSNIEFGGAIPLFYPDWFLYIPALLEASGLSTYHAYKFFVVVCVVAMAFSMYYAANTIFEDDGAALFTAVAYFASSYTITNAFMRSAIGELQGMIFIPLVFAGLWSILCKDGRRWILLPLGMTGLLGCHLLSVMFTVFVLGVFAIVIIIYQCRTMHCHVMNLLKKIFAMAVKSILLTLCLSATFWMPYVEQIISAHPIRLSESFGQHVADRAMPLNEHLIILNQSGWEDLWIPPGIGYVLPSLLIFYIVAFRHLTFQEHKNKPVMFILSAIVMLLATTTVFLPWRFAGSVLALIQFPWRLFAFVVMFIAFSVGAMWLFLKKESNAASAKGRGSVFITVCVISILATYSTTLNLTAPTERSSTFFDSTQNRFNDYIPAGVDVEALDLLDITGEPVDAITFSNYNNTGICWSADFEKSTEDVVCEFPVIWYKGFTAHLDDGTELATQYGNNDVVRVVIPESVTSGTIFLRYSGTNIQKISYVLSLISALILIVYNARRFFVKVNDC